MNFVHLVVDGFPYLNECEYAMQLSAYIEEQRAFVMIDHHQFIGAMLWNKDTNHIYFLGVHPQYKKKYVIKAFLSKINEEFLHMPVISTTTFREGDKADLGYRKAFEGFGFRAKEFMFEFGYPTQKMILLNENTYPEN